MSTRISGVFLAIASSIFLITTIDYVSTVATFEGGENATVDDRMVWAKSVFSQMANGWMFEMIAVGLFAAVALSLNERASKPGWAMTAVGALITAPQYALLRGGRGEIFASDEINTQLYLTVSKIASEAYYAGQGFMMLGLGLVFFLEFAQDHRPLPRWLLGIGGFFSCCSGLFFLLMYTNVVDSYMFAGLTGLAALAAAAILGVGLAMQKRNEGLQPN